MALTTPSMSPSITVREFDLTGVAPNVDTSLSGMVGKYKWGPVNEPVLLANEDDLASTFGTPDADDAVDYYTASQYLKYSGNLYVCRQTSKGVVAVGDSALNATIGGVKLQVENEKHFEQQDIDEMFLAKYPGEIGNSLAVKIFSRAAGTSDSQHAQNWENWDYRDRFDNAPGTSVWAENLAGPVTNDEIHLVVVDSDGGLTGTKDTVLETFAYVSVARGAKTADGGNNFVKSVVNEGSEYLWFGEWADSTAGYAGIGTNWGTAPVRGTPTDYATATATDFGTSFEGGTDGAALDVGDYKLGYDNFQMVDEIDVQMLICPGMNTADDQVEIVSHVTQIAGVLRKDCVAVTSPNRAAVVNNFDAVNDTLETTNRFPSSSYLIVDNNYLRSYDKYNDQWIYLPAASTTCGIMALSDYNYGPWWSPAGERRGEYFGASNLAYSPNKTERDELYKKGVNPIVQFAGRGILLFGDKTKLSRPSAFDRINVRRLFLAIEKSISEAARNFLFEFNDEFTRAEFVAIVEPLLREIQSRRGIQDYHVQCDELNNTPEVIDRNEMVATMFIKPARSINFITLNFVATRTGLDFDEVVGRVSF
jgi:phage tail sheath protein FI